MCYYATIDYACGDWKWGNMMLRCPRQHRIGETCGAKLVHHESVTKSSSVCKICEEINTKQRRLNKTVDSISRWSKEPDKFSASLEKARREGCELQEKIRELNLRRPSIATNIGSAASTPVASPTGPTPPSAAPLLPPLTAMTAGAGAPGYEYTTTSGSSRRQEQSPYSVPRNGVTGSVSLGTSSQYSTVPAASYTNRSATMGNGTSANLAINQRGSPYTVSYARR